MQGEGDAWELYVFDALRGVWLREDDTHALDFAQLDGALYYLDADTGKVMICGRDYEEEGRLDWSATLCQMDETTHGRKIYSKLYLRAQMEQGSWLKVEISADGAPFRQVFLTHNERAKTAQIPILPTRCDNFRIRLSGRGVCLSRAWSGSIRWKRGVSDVNLPPQLPAHVQQNGRDGDGPGPVQLREDHAREP